MTQKKPLLIFNWTPNWVESVYAGSFIEFPAYTYKCEEAPSWGTNPKYLWDCGNPSGGWLKIAISNQLKSRSQCAYEVVQRFQLNNRDIAMAATLVDVENLDVQGAANAWIEHNLEYVQQLLGSVNCQ